MTRKVEGIGHTSSIYEDKFQVTHEWCLAINNIDYVRTSIPTFSKDLGLDDIISALADFQNPSAADHCKQTLTIIVENAMETVGNKILELQDTVVSKVNNHFIINTPFSFSFFFPKNKKRIRIVIILDFLCVAQMSPSINRFLMEGAELLHRESNSVERLMQYLDENLIMLNNQLNEDNFQGILNVIWNTVALLLNQLVKNSLEVRILYKIKKKKILSYLY